MTELVHATTGELIDYQPVSPMEIEFIIREIGERLETAVPVLKQMWRDRYEAERELIKARATAMLNSKADSVTEKRAEADLAALPHRLEFDLKKEALHAAEELQKALTAKLYGYLNLNKALASSYNATGR
ncbi:proline dehydrogenase [Leifsonia xyli subsp. cynodontis DSM 46306]|uniref:Uncharacterized protein n=1 Tax=Leifsonia xyli subsp. cynodontis DSM 46306 TaxID=1389489 RepID=U3P8C3_LEIXC|nr:hypothetical protein [Leifsonia xyli]AGW41719.1 proline dehydrogenase [Leifsonia xyli subsp. cynodontis DSM 46306]AGW42242.1 proline dehydrogenase [Leifsonia xyli subsp. cynodontis DSM 46306]